MSNSLFLFFDSKISYNFFYNFVKTKICFFAYIEQRHPKKLGCQHNIMAKMSINNKIDSHCRNNYILLPIY